MIFKLIEGCALLLQMVINIGLTLCNLHGASGQSGLSVFLDDLSSLWQTPLFFIGMYFVFKLLKSEKLESKE